MTDLARVQRIGAATEVGEPQAATAAPMIKRALDLAGSIFGLVALAPVFGAISLAIRLDSPGPVFFKQERIGRDGVPFTMYKFRTMVDGNTSDVHEQYVAQMIQDGDQDLRNRDGAFKLENDPRITRVGKLLRTSSLDELPQLINVLLGEMSLVGPRPPLRYEVELYTQRHRRRLATMPGMTGLWQVSGRNETTFEEMVDLDIAYIENYSPLLDLRILLRTVSVVLSGKGA